MKLPKETIDELNQINFKYTCEHLSDDEVLVIEARIVGLLSIIGKQIPIRSQ